MNRFPMLLRVLLVMVLAVLAVQLCNFAILQYIRLPDGPSFPVEEVAQAIATRSDDGHSLRLFEQQTEPAMGNGRAIDLRSMLARELHAPVDAVRLSFVDPSLFVGPPRGSGPGRHPHGDRGGMLVGDFTIGAHQPSGNWLVVQPVRNGMAAWRLRLLLWLAATVGAVVPFAWLLARWVTRPLGVFARAAQRIGDDPRSAPLPADGPAEIRAAAAAMNDMQSRIAGYIDERTVMIGAIAHDLRTPLMRLVMRMEQVPDGLRGKMRRDANEMEVMIAAATDYVREARASRPRRRLDLRSLAETVAAGRIDRGENVVIDSGPPVVVDGDAVMLKTLIDNLVGNAVRYAGAAEVALAGRNGEAVLEVLDRGPGVEVGDLPHLFEPFFRAERSRNAETGGIGLGMASVRRVAQSHAGSVEAILREGGGLAVRFIMPLAEPP